MPPLESLPLPRRLSWETFVESAVAEGLAPLICENNRDLIANGRIPGQAASHLEEAWLSSVARAGLSQQALHDIAGLLSGLDAIPLKGAYLASRVYSSPTLRPFSDMDILVRRRDFGAAADRLARAGFRQESRVDLSAGMPPVSAYLNSAVFRQSQGGPSTPLRAGLAIHVHWHLLNSIRPLFLSAAMNMDNVWESARRHHPPFVELCPEHLIIHLAAHAAQHSFDRLILIRDLAEVVEKFRDDIDWSKLAADSETFNLPRVVYYSLLLAARKTAADIPATALEALAPRNPGLFDRLFLKLAKTGARRSELGPLIFVCQATSWRERARLACHMAFPPRSVLAHAYNREPDRIGVMAYVRRLIRGVRGASLAAGRSLGRALRGRRLVG